MGANSRSPVLKYRSTEHADIVKKGWIAKQNRAVSSIIFVENLLLILIKYTMDGTKDLYLYIKLQKWCHLQLISKL